MMLFGMVIEVRIGMEMLEEIVLSSILIFFRLISVLVVLILILGLICVLCRIILME